MKLQAAAADLRSRKSAAPAGDISIAPFLLWFPPGLRDVEDSINLQGIDAMGWGLDGSGCVLHCKVLGKTIFDALGSRWGMFRNLTLVGDESGATPAIGLQVGRLTSTGVTDCHSFEHIKFTGAFSKACLYNLASETGTYDHITAYNEDETGNAYAVVIDGSNHIGAVSDFTAPNMPADTPMSCIQHTFTGCDFRNRKAGVPFWCGHVDQLDFNNSYVVAVDDAGAVLFDSGDGFSSIRLEMHSETHAPAAPDPGITSYIRFERAASGAVNINGLHIREQAMLVSDEIIKTGTNVTALNIENFDIEVHEVGLNPTNGLFSAPSIVSAAGRISLPNEDWIDVNEMASYTGSPIIHLGLNTDSLNGGQLAGFRNKIRNGAFRVWQRGISFSNPANGDFLADGWKYSSGLVGATVDITRVAKPGALGQFGLRYNRTVAAASGSGETLLQDIEGSHTLATRTVTVSLEYTSSKAFTGSMSLSQQFGSGGSPSGTVTQSMASISFQLTATPIKLIRRVTLPAIEGKTLGSNGDDDLRLAINLDIAGTLDFSIFKVQVEGGAQATPFEERPLPTEMIELMRYYQAKVVRSENGSRHIPFYPPMRAAPTVTVSVGSAANITTHGFELTHTAAADVTVTAAAEI